MDSKAGISLIWAVNSGIGIFAGTIFFFIMYRTRKDPLLIEYTESLLQNVIVDFLYCIVGLIVRPEVNIVDGVLIFATHAFDYNISQSTTVVFIFSFVLSVIYLSVIEVMPFYFRYIALCTSKGITAKDRIYSILYPLIATLIFAVLLILSIQFYPEKEAACKELIRRPYMINITYSELKRWNFVCVEPHHILFTGVLVILGLLNVINYCFIAIVNYKILRKLKHDNMMPEIKSAYQQFQVILILQTILPTIGISIPYTINTISYIFNFKNFNKIADIMNIFHSFVGIINPLCSIIGIKQYRDELQYLLTYAMYIYKFTLPS